jgi:hypothetical protein
MEIPANLSSNCSVPTFAIAIEWENARFAELDRTRKMLRRLRQEFIELSPPQRSPEVIFLYDRQSIDGNLVVRVIDEEFQPQKTPARLKIIPTDHLRYYQQKNLGATLTEGEIVIFLDCDVIPEKGWLAAMLDAFVDPRVNVVGGETYVDFKGVFSKALALFWFFNLRSEASDLVPATLFHANNVAFRRRIFAIYQFPDLSTYRAQCTLLGEILRANGVELLRQQRARVSHPYPLSVGYFIARALHNGRDNAILGNIRNDNNSERWRSVLRSYPGRLSYAMRRIVCHRDEVALNAFGAITGFAVAFAYFTLQMIGEAVSIARPNLVRRLFPI